MGQSPSSGKLKPFNVSNTHRTNPRPVSEPLTLPSQTTGFLFPSSSIPSYTSPSVRWTDPRRWSGTHWNLSRVGDRHRVIVVDVVLYFPRSGLVSTKWKTLRLVWILRRGLFARKLKKILTTFYVYCIFSGKII